MHVQLRNFILKTKGITTDFDAWTYVHTHMKVWEDMVCMTVCSYTDEESRGQDAPPASYSYVVQRRVKIHH